MEPEILAWVLFVGGFSAYYAPRILVSQKLEFSSNQITAQRADLARAVKLFPSISLGYLVLIGGACVSMIFLFNLPPYPDGLACLSIFWSGLGIGESLFALLTKVMSVSNRLQYRYAIVDTIAVTRLLKLQLIVCMTIVILSVLYLIL